VGELRDLACRAGVVRDVDLRIARDERGPLALGLVRATILLPPSARRWPLERRRTVLLHELAHVARGDCRSQALAHIACALYWFNPLVWLAARELRRERERACDDLVLRQGTRASDYAACLLEVARAARMPSVALAMARRSELEGRLLAVFSDRARVPAIATKRLLPVCVLLCSAALLGVQAVASTPPRPSEPTQPRLQTTWTPPLVADPPPRQTSHPALRELDSSDPAVRSRAALALADGDQTASVNPLVNALSDPSPDVREKAALALGLQSHRAVVQPLIGALRDPDPQVREKAALGLALRRDAVVVQPLIDALDDPDGQVREKAAIALGTSGDERARPALEAALEDPDPQVREKASTALTLLGVSASVADRESARDGLRALVGTVLSLMR
jgi:hypothetical protein